MEHIDPIKSVLLPYINFAIFLGLLIYFARKPLAKLAQDKRLKFDAALAEAKAAHVAAEEKSKGLSQKLASLDRDVQRIREQTKHDAEKESERLIASAHELAKNLESEAVRVAQGELVKSREGLRQEIVDAVKKTIIERVTHDLTPDKQRDLIHKQMELLQSLASNTKSAGNGAARQAAGARPVVGDGSGVGGDAR